MGFFEVIRFKIIFNKNTLPKSFYKNNFLRLSIKSISLMIRFGINFLNRNSVNLFDSYSLF